MIPIPDPGLLRQETLAVVRHAAKIDRGALECPVIVQNVRDRVAHDGPVESAVEGAVRGRSYWVGKEGLSFSGVEDFREEQR